MLYVLKTENLYYVFLFVYFSWRLIKLHLFWITLDNEKTLSKFTFSSKKLIWQSLSQPRLLLQGATRNTRILENVANVHKHIIELIFCLKFLPIKFQSKNITKLREIGWACTNTDKIPLNFIILKVHRKYIYISKFSQYTSIKIIEKPNFRN